MTLTYRVTSLLIQNLPADIHELLDIRYETVHDACSMFKGVMDNFSEQVCMFPEREKFLAKELKKIRQQTVASLLYISQKHGEISLDGMVGT